jgi:hypothetical protein
LSGTAVSLVGGDLGVPMSHSHRQSRRRRGAAGGGWDAAAGTRLHRAASGDVALRLTTRRVQLRDVVAGALWLGGRPHPRAAVGCDVRRHEGPSPLSIVAQRALAEPCLRWNGEDEVNSQFGDIHIQT